MKLLAFTTVLVLAAGMAVAADIDGKWEGEVQGMGGDPMKISYTFKADGTTLTGTTKGMDGNDLQITDGKIEGNQLSYSIDFGGMPMKFKGVLKGDQIELTMDMGDMGGGGGAPPMDPIILKKVK